MENIGTLHVGMHQLPYAQHGRMTDKHLFLMDTVVTFLTGPYLPTPFILPGFHFVHNQNIF